MCFKLKYETLFAPLIPEFISMILIRLHRAGFQAYVVGGAIRDALLGYPVRDWDVATSASPDQIRSVFSDIKNFSLKHETITLVNGGNLYDITAFRGGGHPDYGINEDLGCRDFTINAMAYDIVNNVLLDPCGGRDDFRKKRIRAVGNPADRFEEDPLRLLRGIRIHAETGFSIERHTFESIRNMAGLLKNVAMERVRDELMKILVSPRAGEGFSFMRRSGILEILIPELLEGYRMKQNSYHKYTVYRHTMETIRNIKPDPLLRLVALFHDIAKPRVRKVVRGKVHFFQHAEAGAELAGSIMERMKFSRSTIKATTHLIKMHTIDYQPEWSDGAIRRFIRRVGEEHLDNLFLFRRADLEAHGVMDEKIEWLSDMERRVRKLKEGEQLNDLSDLALDGREVMEILGILPGPEVGRKLELLMERVEENPELNTKNRLRIILKNQDTA